MPSRTALFRAESRNFWLAAGALAIVGFTLNLAVSWSFFHRNVYYCINSIFDADPAIYLQYLLGIARTARRHPLMMFFDLPLSLPGGPLDSLLHWPFRTAVAILYGPAVAAAKTVLLMLTMRRLSLPLWWSSLIALADILCFARLTVGSMPESFGPTATVFAAVFLLTACALTGDRIRLWIWICCGVLLGGITITNAIPWALVLFYVLLQSGAPFRSALLTTIRGSAVAALAIVAIYGAMLRLRPPPPLQGPTEDRATNPQPAQQLDLLEWLRFHPQILVTTLPTVDAYAFAGARPILTDNASTHLQPFFPGHSVPRLSLWMPLGWTPQGALMLVLVHGLLVLGILGWFTGPPWNRQLGIPALLVVGFQFALHCFWAGPEMFLYVLHWQTPLLIVMAGGWLRRGWVRWAAVTGLFMLIVCEIVMNGGNLVFAMHALDAQFIPK
jgi:hypothetical protein